MLVDEVAPDRYYWAPLAQHERGSLASLDSLRKGGPAPGSWRQPELPEVIAMLSFRLDAVKSNAAAYLQHLCYRNDKVKTEVRKLKGIPVLVGLLDHPKKEVHYGACGALKNISFGKDQDNKIAIKNCDGVPALVRLLRKAHDMDLTEVITGNGEGTGWFGGRGGHQEGFKTPRGLTAILVCAPAGTLWNLSSHDSIKMAIVDNALHALTDEVVIPRSGWEREPNEDSKPRHIEWESVLTNTAGCLRYGLLEDSWCGLGCCKAPPRQSHTAKWEQPCSPQRSCSPGTAAGAAALNFGGVPLGGEKPGGC